MKKLIKEQLRIDKSFGIIAREIIIGRKDALLVFISGFVKDDIMLWLISVLQSSKTRRNFNKYY